MYKTHKLDNLRNFIEHADGVDILLNVSWKLFFVWGHLDASGWPVVAASTTWRIAVLVS